MPLYLLDTNIFVHAIRNSPIWQQRIVATYAPMSSSPVCLYSIVTAGELRSLAIQLAWGSAKKNQMLALLGYFGCADINAPSILQDYAIIDAYCKDHGLTLGKNDLWIAATTSATGATLLTTDKDFDPLHDIFLNRIWIDPT